MRARPKDITAYSPAVRIALTSTPMRSAREYCTFRGSALRLPRQAPGAGTIAGLAPGMSLGQMIWAPRSVADQLVAEPLLGVLTMHGDVIGQVGIRQKDIGLGSADLGEQWRKVGAVQIERLIQHDREKVRIGRNKVLHPFLI